MFIQIDTLPSAQGETSISDRNVQRGPHQRALDVTRHVVISFHSMAKCAVAVPLGRHQFVQGDLHVSPDIWVGIFVDGEGSRGVLNEKVAHADFDLGQILGDCLLNVRGDQMAATGGGGN